MFKKEFRELLSKIAATILTIYALFTLPVDIIDKTKSPALGIALAVIVSLILGIGTVYYLMPPFTLKRFGVKRHKTSPILVESNHTIDIDESFVANVRKDKKIVFTEKPTSDDLVDLIEVSDIDYLDETTYFSIDSRVTQFLRKKKNTLAVYWEPTKEIIPNTIYNHVCGYVSPSLYGDDGFWHTCYVDMNTGVVSYKFNCKNEIETAIAFKMPYFNTTVRYKTLDKLAFIKNRRDCAQPKISADKKIIHWRLTNPGKHRSYVCLVFYKDGVQSFRNQIRRNWLEKLFTRIS